MVGERGPSILRSISAAQRADSRRSDRESARPSQPAPGPREIQDQQCLGETNRVLQVLKARGSRHSNQKREYVIGDNGIHILDPYVGEGEVLTGSLRQRQENRDRLEAQRLDYEIEAKELELKRLRLARELAMTGVARRAEMTGGSGSLGGVDPGRGDIAALGGEGKAPRDG